jgi:hypothetical protein
VLHVPVRTERRTVEAVGTSGATFCSEGTHLTEEVCEEGFHGREAGGDNSHVHFDSVEMVSPSVSLDWKG